MAKLKMRQRAATYAVFDRRYGPIDADDGGIVRPWNDPEVLAAFDRGEEGKRMVWTIVDGGRGCYIVPGFATVNYVGRVLCERPWPDEEMSLPGYFW